MKEKFKSEPAKLSRDILFEAYPTEERILSAITNVSESAHLALESNDTFNLQLERQSLLMTIAREEYSTSYFEMERAILEGLSLENRLVHFQYLGSTDFLSKKELAALKKEFSL